MLYITKEEANITFKTKIRFDGNNYNIYNIKITHPIECEKFFSVRMDIKFIIYLNDEILYCVNLDNDNIEEASSYIKSIKFDEGLFLKRHTYYQFHHNYLEELCSLNKKEYLINYFDFRNCDFSNNFDLTSAKIKLEELNNQLQKKCPEYRLGLDYVYNINNFEPTIPLEVNMFKLDPNDLLLCIFDSNSNSCVSSITLNYELDDKKTITIDSKTQDEYLKKKINMLLRSIVIILSKLIYPDSLFLDSYAINPISAYTMIKYFDASNKKIKELNLNLEDEDLFSKLKSLMIDEGNLDLKVKLDDKIIGKAESVFDAIITSGIICEKELDLQLEQAEAGAGEKEPTVKKEPETTAAPEPPTEPPIEPPPEPPQEQQQEPPQKLPSEPPQELPQEPPQKLPQEPPREKLNFEYYEYKNLLKGGKRTLKKKITKISKKKKKKKSKRVKSIKKNK